MRKHDKNTAVQEIENRRLGYTLYVSLTMNLLYAAVQIGSGARDDAAWGYALGGYYAILAAARFFLLKEAAKRRLGRNVFWEYLHYRLCGILLLVLNAALGVVVFFVAWRGQEFGRYGEIVTIALAAYTFFGLGAAAAGAARCRRCGSPVLAAARNISLAAALVSLLPLETAMLWAFDDKNDGIFRAVTVNATGMCICVAILGMAAGMLTKASREIKKIKQETREIQNGEYERGF